MVDALAIVGYNHTATGHQAMYIKNTDTAKGLRLSFIVWLKQPTHDEWHALVPQLKDRSAKQHWATGN